MKSKNLLLLLIFTIIPLLVFGQTQQGSYLRFDRYVSSDTNSDTLVISGRGYIKYAGNIPEISVPHFDISVVHKEPQNPNSERWLTIDLRIPETAKFSSYFKNMLLRTLGNDVVEFNNLLVRIFRSGPEGLSWHILDRENITPENVRLVIPPNQTVVEGVIEKFDKNSKSFTLTFAGKKSALIRYDPNITIFVPEEHYIIASGEWMEQEIKGFPSITLLPDEALQEGNKVLVRYNNQQNLALKVVLLEKAKPMPRAKIISLPRTQEIRVPKAGEQIKENFQFTLENFPEDIKNFELVFNFSHTLLKDVQVKVDEVATPTVETRMIKEGFKVTLPFVNGTHSVELIGTVRDYQDKDYPYQGGTFKIDFVQVKPLAEIKYKSEGRDSSHAYAIYVPYYPNTSSTATVGAEEYPALVLYQDPQTKEVGIYFTSFDGRFRSIHVGLQHPNGQRKEIVKDCKGRCPRDVDQLIKQFGHPSEWGFLILKFKPERTVLNRGSLTMNKCYGTLNFDLSQLRNTMMVCSNRKAFGNNYGWGRQMVANLRWAYQPTTYQYAEKLDYEFILPRDIDQHFSPAPRMKQTLKEEDLKLLLRVLSNILLQLK